MTGFALLKATPDNEWEMLVELKKNKPRQVVCKLCADE
jgi:hypothetical protein